MIQLSIQFNLIFFSFLFGFFFSVFIEIFNKKTYKYKSYLKLILSFIFILLITLIYFFGIKLICNGILHIYSIISVIIGFITYDIILFFIANKNKK